MRLRFDSAAILGWSEVDAIRHFVNATKVRHFGMIAKRMPYALRSVTAALTFARSDVSSIQGAMMVLASAGIATTLARRRSRRVQVPSTP